MHVTCQTHGQNAAHAELMLMHRMNSICCQTICAETDDDDDDVDDANVLV